MSRPTQGTPRSAFRFPYGALTPCGPPFHAVPVASAVCFAGAPTTPRRASTPAVWAAPLSLAATRGITVVFFSCGYWDVSVPRVGPAASAAVRGTRRVGSPIRTPPDLRPFAPPRGFSQPVASFFAPRSQGIRRTPLILSFWLYSFCLSALFLCFFSQSSCCHHVNDPFFSVENKGLEPLTPCLQGRCSKPSELIPLLLRRDVSAFPPDPAHPAPSSPWQG